MKIIVFCVAPSRRIISSCDVVAYSYKQHLIKVEAQANALM